jgi:hypothetical protein
VAGVEIEKQSSKSLNPANQGSDDDGAEDWLKACVRDSSEKPEVRWIVRGETSGYTEV